MDAIDRALRAGSATAYAMVGSSTNADMRYISRFITTDPIVYIRRVGERGTIIVSQMEYDRALQEAATAVMTRADAGLLRLLEEEKDRSRAMARMIADLGGENILVPPDLSYSLGKNLEEYTRVTIDTGTIAAMRAVKSGTEIAAIHTVQRATEQAMSCAIEMVRRSHPRKDLLWLDGRHLTSDRIRAAMHGLLIRKGFIARETIVSCGSDTAAPHNRGTGPLYEGQPVVIDIFPLDERTGYYADMTRTVVKGEPSPEIREMYEAVREAQDHAAAMMSPGVTGQDLYTAVVDFFAERGYRTGAEGFTHNLGHGVGLEVHELPVIGPGGGVCVRGNVITNEPGLYYPRIGGVRLENIGVFTRSGFRCLTSFPRELVV